MVLHLAIAERVRLRQIESLIRQTPIIATTNLVNATLTGLAVWTFEPAPVTTAWVAAVALVSGVSLLRWWRRRNLPPLNTVRQAMIVHAVAYTAIVGALWGFAGFVMFPADVLVGQLILAFVIGGMCAGAVAAMSNFRAVCHTFVLTSATPLALRFALAGGATQLVMAAMICVYVIALLVVCHNGFRTFLHSVHMELEITALLNKVALARDEAEAANRAKSQFIAVTSHELRTPLNAVIGFSEMIRDQMLGPVGSPQYREYAKDIHESGSHLLSLINDILDISKLETGNVELDEADCCVATIAEAALRLVRERAHHDAITLAREGLDALPVLQADERRLKQILLNLLSNAVKFTPAGGQVTVRGSIDSTGAMLLSVEDNGIGMAPEDIPRALAPFAQVDSDLGRRYEGTGLGLPLTKSLVELHGGTLEIDSAVGHGTTVTVRMPADRVAASGDGRPDESLRTENLAS